MVKGKKKKIIITLLIIVQDIVLFVGIIWGIGYIKEKQRLDASPYYTEQELPYSVTYVLDRGYKMWTRPNLDNLNENNVHWPDFTYCILEPSSGTEKAIQFMNYDLFYDLDEYDQEAYDIAASYGLSRDNLMTIEWVLEHPYEAAEIYLARPYPDWYIGTSVNINELMAEYETGQLQ